MLDVYFDVSDIFYKVRKYHGKKVNYKKLMEAITEEFGEIKDAVAFGCQTDNEAKSFIGHLNDANISVRYRRPKMFTVGDQGIKSCNWNVDITISAMCSESKTIVFCSSNPDLIPLYRHLQNMGKKVIVMGSGIPESVKVVVDICKPIVSFK
jgi:uncharacterized LabA/DUF88 family protein